VAHDASAPVHETASAVDATAAGGTTAATDTMTGMSSSLPQTGATATSPYDDVFEVVVGHTCLQALEPTPFPEALDVAHSALR
jgi:hypothetical protein